MKTLKSKLEKIAERWANTENNFEKIVCDRSAHEYINNTLRDESDYPIKRLQYATFYVNTKVKLRKISRECHERMKIR